MELAMAENDTNDTSASSGIQRPYKFTPELAETIIKLVRNGTPLTTVAHLTRIGRMTLWRWINDGETYPDGPFGEFARELRASQGMNQEALLDVIREASLEDPKWAAWQLEKLYPQQFGRGAQVEVHTHVSQPAQVIDVSGKSTEALEAELEEMDG